MKFYRTLHAFKVISFDLDDTLYDNTEVIKIAEAQFVQKLAELCNMPIDLTLWRQWKDRLFQQDPISCEDVTQWRKNTIRAFLMAQNQQSTENIDTILSQSMAHFLDYRHRINVPPQSREILAQLAQNYPLVAITNGNVTPRQIGLDFALVQTGGVQGRAKPHQDLFHKTAQYFDVQPQEILHVGDNLITDVQGAIQANCQAVWLNLSNKGIREFSEATVLPTLEIENLKELQDLV